MIDFIKSLNTGLEINNLFDNEYLEFKTAVNAETGEINEKRYNAEYKNLKFEIVNKKFVNFSGSIHKYYNNGIQNYNDFSFSNLFQTIQDLNEKFKINPYLAPLNNIEFAVNLNTSFIAKDFIKKSIISHKGTSASVKIFGGKGYLKEFEHSNYYIKIYDKSLHLNRPNNILRFEIKVVKMEYLHEIGIKTLADLLDIKKLQSLGKKLIAVFNEILIIDNTEIGLFTEKEKTIYRNGINPMFWENLKPNSKRYKNGNGNSQYNKDRKKYYRELGKFQSLIGKYNLNKTQKEISKHIEKKWNELMKIDIKKRDKLTAFLKTNEVIFKPTIDETKKGQINRLFKNKNKLKKGQINTSNIGLNCSNSRHKCLVTKLDISMQRKDSKFINIKGLNYYQENKPEIYKELEKRLSEKWENKSVQIRNIQIGHSVRNEYSNKRNNTKRSINKITSTPSLFNNLDLIHPNKLKIARMY